MENYLRTLGMLPTPAGYQRGSDVGPPLTTLGEAVTALRGPLATPGGSDVGLPLNTLGEAVTALRGPLAAMFGTRPRVNFLSLLNIPPPPRGAQLSADESPSGGQSPDAAMTVLPDQAVTQPQQPPQIAAGEPSSGGQIANWLQLLSNPPSWWPQATAQGGWPQATAQGGWPQATAQGGWPATGQGANQTPQSPWFTAMQNNALAGPSQQNPNAGSNYLGMT